MMCLPVPSMPIVNALGDELLDLGVHHHTHEERARDGTQRWPWLVAWLPTLRLSCAVGVVAPHDVAEEALRPKLPRRLRNIFWRHIRRVQHARILGDTVEMVAVGVAQAGLGPKQLRTSFK